MAVRPRIIPDPVRGYPAGFQKGFTLIELIVVIVIVGILAGFAVMSINRTESDGVAVCRADAQRWLDRQAVRAAQQGLTVYIGERNDRLTSFKLSAASEKEIRTRSTSATAPSVPSRVALDTLRWDAGCRIVTRPNHDRSSPFPAPDPRGDAVLAVTSAGHWSASDGPPQLVVRGRQGQEQTVDMSPSPATSSP